MKTTFALLLAGAKQQDLAPAHAAMPMQAVPNELATATATGFAKPQSYVLTNTLTGAAAAGSLVYAIEVLP